MNADRDIHLAGFADPVLDAQRCFRAVLDAMARPGSVHSAGTGLAAPPVLDGATAAVLLTLVDGETPLWLAPHLDAARAWIVFHCGAVCVADATTASFITTDALPDLSALRAGSHEAPETSATVILQVRGFGTGKRYRLHGPGLRNDALLSVDGLPAAFAVTWANNRARFPRGVDLVLCAGSRLAALPRSVSIEDA
jgi:alpha-D-ribose 1-methylphosphonate 5-triphosphate synthase subunit PhnH